MSADLRVALRALWRSPLSTALIVIALGLGIGVNTAIFSLVDVILFRPLAVPEPERLVRVLAMHEGGISESSLPSFIDYRDGTHSFASLAAFEEYHVFHLSLEGREPDRVSGAIVTGRYFETLGVRPALGRTIGTTDDGARGTGQVVVLSDASWRRRFAADARVLGQEVRLNGETFTIVGVLPSSFQGANAGTRPEVFIPMSMAAVAEPGTKAEELFDARDYPWVDIVGRLAPGVGFAAAEAEMEALGKRRRADASAENPDPMPLLRPATTAALDTYYAGAPRVARLLLGIVALVLAIACADAAALLLARGERRRREIAIRLAVGASRVRIVRQLLIESVVLAALGAVLGLFFAHISVSLIVRLVPEDSWLLPADTTSMLDLRMLAVTVAAAIVVGIAFGLVPAFRAARTDVTRGLASDGASLRTTGARLPLGGAFIVGQVAITCVLLVGAGLLVRSLRSVLAVEPGYDVDHGAVAYFDLATQGYDAARAARLESELLHRVRALPEIQSAALGVSVPLQGWGMSVRVREVDGYDPPGAASVVVPFNVVTAGYFETLGVPFVAGHDLSDLEPSNGPLNVVVNQAFERRFCPGGSALGRSFTGLAGLIVNRGATIVGVVRDYKSRSQRESPREMVYGSLAQFPRPRLAVAIRTHARPTAALPLVRRVVRELDPELPLFGVRPLREQWSFAASFDRLLATLLTAFAGLALALAAAGLFGLLSYGVEGRRREIGLRMALGAQAGAIVRLVVREGLVFVAGGLALGLAASLAASRILKTQLFGVSDWDPVAFAGASAVLIGVALLAAHGPARRAARVDPMTALRSE